jgi:hypothetical protein
VDLSVMNHDGVQPVPSSIIFQISSSLKHHLTAWRDSASPFQLAGLRGTFMLLWDRVIRNASEDIITAVTHKLPSTDALTGEPFVTLLTSRMAASLTSDDNYIEEDALLIVLAINNPSIFSSWFFVNCTLTLVLFYHMLQKYLDVQLSLTILFLKSFS